ncbi:MAG: TIGR00266 family protein [Verrucomicrobiota bacterium]|nr:TIGR00266 family protein [Verrucomicrobiota bacterium]
MNINISHSPGNAAAHVHLQPGESFTAEGGAMIAMSSGIQVETTTHKRGSGGVLKAIKRALTGESFFLNHFTAGQGEAEVILGTQLVGDMITYDLAPSMNLIVQSGSYVASHPSVDLDLSWQGFGKALFSGEAMFWIRCSGQGPLVLSAFGSVYPVEVNGEYIVDTGHIVAFEETLNFSITKAGKSWMSSFLGGEGLVCKFNGQGTVWCQSHNADNFGTMLGPLLRPRKN